MIHRILCRLRLSAVLIPTLVLCASRAHADTYEQLEKPAPNVQVGIRLDRTTVPLSGHIILTLVVVGPAPVEVEPLTEAVTSKEWEEKAEGKPETDVLPDKRARWRQKFRLEPFPLDKDKKVPLAVNPLRYRTGDMKPGEWREQAWKPVDITVTSKVVVTDLDDAKGITGIESPPPLRSWAVWQLGAGLGLVAASGIAFGAWCLRRRKPAPAPELPPHAWALVELDRIDGLELPGRGAVERYHTLISDVLRRYIELRLGMRAPEQTTPEFLESLRRSSALTAEQQEQLRDFLHRCDLAKFARAEFSAPECRATAFAAREFIRQTVPTPAAVTRNGMSPT